jgi:glutamine synthetase
MMLVTNQWVNSYKRLVPGYEAPTHATWSARNRADLVRVPERRPTLEVEATRIEYRVPDPACNPYLAFAAVLSAGLAGIEGGYPLPEPLDRNVAELTEEERHRRGLVALPESLDEAIAHFEGSELMRSTLGDHVWQTLVSNKRMEWLDYRRQVTQYEIDRYLVL